MKTETVLLILAVAVVPFLWGYLAEVVTRRLWPESPNGRPTPKPDRDRQQDYFDFQI